jgi:hypothetical protein
VLVQAAAGGVGSLAVRFARLAGAGTIVGIADSDEKRERAGHLWLRRASYRPGHARLPEEGSPATSETVTSGSLDILTACRRSGGPPGTRGARNRSKLTLLT